jgi:glutathione S-transferase
MKLYTNSFSPNCKRPRVLASELGITLSQQELDFAKGDFKKPEYLAKNPMGKVPTLEDDGYVLWESPAMLVYLASKNNSPLFPTDAKGRAEVFRWMFWNASHLETAIFQVAFEKLVKPMMNQPADEAKIASGRTEWERFAPVLNAHLEGKQFIAGSNYTIADICLATTVEFSLAAGFDYERYPHLKAWFGRVTSRDAWKKA